MHRYTKTFTMMGLLLWAAGAAAQSVVVAVPARAGAVDGRTENSDAFVWQLFTQFAAPAEKGKAAPVAFETWASDADTFASTPRWPDPGAPKRLQASVLRAEKTVHGSAAVDVACVPPGNAAVGGFPVGGTPVACIAEETRRNRPQFDYIVANRLNTQAGLAAAYARGFKVVMPDASLSVKGDWVPVTTLLRWIPSLGSVERIRSTYYTAMSGGVEYAVVSLHVSSRQNANWVWGTFEHELNPGRCDDIGCFDTFGAQIAAVPPNRRTINTQYGACAKTPALTSLMAQAGLAPVWRHYCLKSTQVDYAAPDGTPYVLGNSVIERIVGNGTVAASSCIACHAYASFGKDGKPAEAATAMLPYNPTGQPIAAVLEGSVQFDFMWGVLLAPAK